MESGSLLGGSLAVRSQAVPTARAGDTVVAVVGRRGRVGHRAVGVVGAVGAVRIGMRLGLLRKGHLGSAGVKPYLLNLRRGLIKKENAV